MKPSFTAAPSRVEVKLLATEKLVQRSVGLRPRPYSSCTTLPSTSTITPAVLVACISAVISALSAGLSGEPLGSARGDLAAGTSCPANHCSIARKRSERCASFQNSTCSSDWSRAGGWTRRTAGAGGPLAAGALSA